MTPLRLFGVAIALAIAIWAFSRFRVGGMRRLEMLLAWMLSTALLVASVFPEAAGLLRDMLALEEAQHSRLMALTIASNLVLWLLVLTLIARRSTDRDQFDMLLRGMAEDRFATDFPDKVPLAPVAVVLPAYNEADNIEPVLRGLPEEVAGRRLQAIVIDDGSSDGTGAVARAAGVPVVTSPVRRGGGAALRLGFSVAMRHGAEIVVSMDADGQHRAEDLPGLVEPIIADRYDFVIGSRLLGSRERDSRIRLVGIHVFNAVLRLLTPSRITDCSNGYRAMRCDALAKVLLRQDQYHTTELIIEAAKKGFRLGEAPVRVQRRLSGESKKGRSLKYGFNFAKTIVKTWWRNP